MARTLLLLGSALALVVAYPACASDDTNVVHDSSDGAECQALTYPQEDCPCDPRLGSQECCVRAGEGLLCYAAAATWSTFYDCGCSTLPECSEYPIYDLCGWEPDP